MEGNIIDIRSKAVRLRREGFSLSEIANLLHRPKNTVQGWVKDIQLTETQQKKIKEKIVKGGLKGRKKARQVNKNKIDAWKNAIQVKARNYTEIASKNSNIGKLICGVLYLCEGAKYPATRHLVFANSDPRMIRLFLTLLRQNFKLDRKKFRCRIMHRWDQDGDKLKRYWLRITGIPSRQFYRNYIDKRSKGVPTKKENYKGICAIQYFDTNIQFELQSIGEALL